VISDMLLTSIEFLGKWKRGEIFRCPTCEYYNNLSERLCRFCGTELDERAKYPGPKKPNKVSEDGPDMLKLYYEGIKKRGEG